MPQYFLAVNHDEADAARLGELTPEQMQPMFEAVGAFNAKLQAEGAWVFAGGLEGRDAAHVVDHSGDEPVITAGSFSSAPEYLGGFWVIEAADLDAAHAWAAQGSKACQGKVEVRAFQAG